MIISSPFILQSDQVSTKGNTSTTCKPTDNTTVETAMSPTACIVVGGTGAEDGTFPVVNHLIWHNGVHLQAIDVGTHVLPIHAIADGQVVFLHRPSKLTDDKEHGQRHSGGWTDNGCVILKHTTEIGAAGDQPVSIIYYSVYMHLSFVNDEIASGKNIYRKGVLGKTGQIYGHAKQLHFEICCDTDNLKKIIGREPGWQDPEAIPTRDGRTDCIFGNLYIYLPATTPISDKAPTEHLRTDTGTTLGTAQWIKLDYGDDGKTPGTCALTSYSTTAQVGATRNDIDAEYNLYKEATDRHNRLVKAHPTVKSSPSGWYELLRFGRNIGQSATVKDPLPDNAAHWRRIKTLDGQDVWADLNAPGTYKFSDADFLPQFGWNCYDDDTNPKDQRCDSARLKALLREEGDQADPDRHEDDVKLSKRLADKNVRQALRKAICKFPTEWDKPSIIERTSWLKEVPYGAKDRPDKWARFERHLRAVTFDGLPQEYKDAQWHFHPTEFVKHFRKCGWLSLEELAQTYPRYPHYEPNKEKTITDVLKSKIFTVSKEMARARFKKYQIELNRCLRKYCINTPLRISHFLSQCMTETAQWRDLPRRPIMHEWGFGQFNEGNKNTKHYAAFYGRGIMQLTWASNYREYGKFKSLPSHHGAYVERLMSIPRIDKQSMHVISKPKRKEAPQMMVWFPRYDPDIIASNTHLACDSGGFYWVSKHHSGVININKKCDEGDSIDVVDEVNIYVNGGENGYQDRQAYFKYIIRELSDTFKQIINFSLKTKKGVVNVNYEKPN